MYKCPTLDAADSWYSVDFENGDMSYTGGWARNYIEPYCGRWYVLISLVYVDRYTLRYYLLFMLTDDYIRAYECLWMNPLISQVQ